MTMKMMLMNIYMVPWSSVVGVQPCVGEARICQQAAYTLVALIACVQRKEVTRTKRERKHLVLQVKSGGGIQNTLAAINVNYNLH